MKAADLAPPGNAGRPATNEGGRPRSSKQAQRLEETTKQLEATKKEEELQEQVLREKHRYLVDRLRADIRYFAHAMQEFIDLPQEPGQTRTWEQSISEMLADMNTQAGVLDTAEVSIDPIVILLNYRDRIMTSILMGALYQKAVLNDDVQLPPTIARTSAAPPTPGLISALAGAAGAAAAKAPNGGAAPVAVAVAPAEDPMVELQEHVRVLRAKLKSSGLPDKYALKELPSAAEPGYFTYGKEAKSSTPNDGQSGSGIVEKTSVFQSSMLSIFREMDGLERHLRQMKFGKRVAISQGKYMASEELRKEIAKIFNKCSRLEHELQMSKAQQHAALDVQVEQNMNKCEVADKEIKKMQSKQLKLQGDVEGAKAESHGLRREKAEMAEKQQEMASEHLPVLNKIDKHLGELRKCADQLSADAEMLSQMFKLQVQDSKTATSERDAIAKELASLNSTLRREKLKNQLKDIELAKKETLHQRTIEARQATLDSYGQGKELIKEAETRLKRKEAEWKDAEMEMSRRNIRLDAHKEDMRRATIDVDDLEQQKKECMKEFKASTGKPYAMLLEQYKIKPTEEAQLKSQMPEA